MRNGRLQRRRASRFGWLGAVAAPWAGGLGLLVVLTASTGGDIVGSGWRTAFEARTRHAGNTPNPALIRVNTTGSLGERINPGAALRNTDLEPGDFGALPENGATDPETESLELSDGATPAVPKAVALSSVTPAPADAVPIEVAASTLALPGFSPRLDRAPDAAPQDGLDGGPQHYADLIQPDAMDREQRCLAEAVYFEARSEPEDGQAAVAQVILNRVKSGLYPSNVCGVVYQNRHRYMGCQFSFACEGKSLRITDAGSWQTATRIASAVIDGKTYLSEVGGATHYHASYVRPGWSRRLKKMDVIGRHIFYQLKRGQT